MKGCFGLILPFVAVLWREFVAGSDRYWLERGAEGGGGAVDWYSMDMPIRSLAGTQSGGRFATTWPRGERAVDFPKSRRDDGQCGPAGERPGPAPYAAVRAVSALSANNAPSLADRAGRPAGAPAGRAIGTGLTVSSARTRIPRESLRNHRTYAERRPIGHRSTANQPPVNLRPFTPAVPGNAGTAPPQTRHRNSPPSLLRIPSDAPSVLPRSPYESPPETLANDRAVTLAENSSSPC